MTTTDDPGAELAECCHDERRARALAHLGQAHRSGALGDLAAGHILGDLDPSSIVLDRSDIDREESAFDERLNAWMVDYQGGFGKIPPAVSAQVDAYIERWRAFHASWYLIGVTRASSILAFQAEWNRLKDQVAGYGATSAVEAATALVDGKQVRADQIPPGSSTLDRVTMLVKWGGLLLGARAAYKLVSDLGIVSRIGRMVSGGGGGGGGGGPVRRYGSAKRQRNPAAPAAKRLPSVPRRYGSAKRTRRYGSAKRTNPRRRRRS